MFTTSTTRGSAAKPEGPSWQPLSSVDFMLLGFVSIFQLQALVICFHLIWCRKWPPYVTKNVILVVISTVSGILWTLAMANATGYWRRQPGDILAACDFEQFLSWSTLTVHWVAFSVRIYRMWRILIKHAENMWSAEHQVLFSSSLCLIPVICTWAIPRTGYFDAVANTCSTTSIGDYMTLGMNFLGLCTILFLWFVCARQLKLVRKQFNEYNLLRWTLRLMTIVLLSFALVIVVLLRGTSVAVRRVSIFYPLVTTYILLWGSIGKPFMKKMVGDKDYVLSYTKGFMQLPSPAQLRASLAEQLSVNQLRTEFRRYIKSKVAQELIDFYLDSLDREEVVSFWERQAVTMRIIEQFIKEGAQDQVNISAECREKILATDVTAFDLFDDARAEVLAVMETNFRRDFVSTEGFRRIADASEEEQLELRRLRDEGVLPGTPASPEGAARTVRTAQQRETGPMNTFKKFPFIKDVVAASERRRVSKARRIDGLERPNANPYSNGS